MRHGEVVHGEVVELVPLISLEPRWFADEGRHGQGLTFYCPDCLRGKCKQIGTRLAVPFQPTLDGGPPIRLRGTHREWESLLKVIRHGEVVPPGIIWTRIETIWTQLDGQLFETLTVMPSVDCSAAGHWHGYLRDGHCT